MIPSSANVKNVSNEAIEIDEKSQIWSEKGLKL
jgi:hypothetical protein